MKPTINILKLPVRLGCFFLFIFISQQLSAQEDSMRITRDSVRIKLEGTLEPSQFDFLPEKSTDYPLNLPKQSSDLPKFSLKKSTDLPYHTNPSLLFRGDYRTGGILKQFPRGVLFGSGGQTSIPGIGRFNNASLGYQHAINDKLELQLNINALKMNMAHMTGQSFGTSGALLYHASDRVSFKLFGSYDIGNSYGMSTHVYGATMSLDMSDRFGMEVGVQRYYDSMRGRWETVPIVIPYYNFDKFKLGFDVGGLLFEILRDVVFDKSRNNGSRTAPTIAPPRFSFPVR